MLDNNAFRVDLTPIPRIKEEYKNIADSNPITFYLGDEFREEIEYNVLLNIHRLGKDIFPIKGKCSIILDIFTDRPISSIGILKNCLDACNRILITDDKKVESALVRIHSSGGEKESLLLKLVTGGRSINGVDVDEDDISPFMAFTMKMDTVLEDRYLQYPGNIDTKLVLSINNDCDKKLSSAIEDAFDGVLFNNDLSVSLAMNMCDSNSDIDNVALSFLKNCTGIVYKDIRQIKTLHIKIKNNVKDKEHYAVNIASL